MIPRCPASSRGKGGRGVGGWEGITSEGLDSQ